LSLELIYLLSISTAIITAIVSSKNNKYTKYLFLLLLLLLVFAHFCLLKLVKFGVLPLRITYFSSNRVQGQMALLY